MPAHRIRLDVTTPAPLPHPVDADELVELVAKLIARRWGVLAKVTTVYNSTDDPGAR